MFGVNDEHDCSVAIMNYLNIHDVNDMQSHKLGGGLSSILSLGWKLCAIVLSSLDLKS